MFSVTSGARLAFRGGADGYSFEAGPILASWLRCQWLWKLGKRSMAEAVADTKRQIVPMAIGWRQVRGASFFSVGDGRLPRRFGNTSCARRSSRPILGADFEVDWGSSCRTFSTWTWLESDFDAGRARTP